MKNNETEKLNTIEKKIELAAPISRVWQAITDSKQFGQWFRVKFDEPFAVNQPIRGVLTYPGYEDRMMEIVVKKIEPENLFAYTWHPYAIDTSVDYSNETPTLVEFHLQAQNGGTLLTVIESGFENVPAARRDEAFRMNTNGWTHQVKNIEQYLALAAKTN
ncbi:MAG: SRPBCC family protein [Candidatus Obscuribacterales bacterium]|nr:SRPBCC family protein [Candidatus Obscuribacterales bacterium]